MHKVTQLVRAHSQLQHGRSVQHHRRLFPVLTLPPHADDFISMETSGGDACPDEGATPPVHSPPGVKAREGRERDEGWIFFSSRQQRLTEDLVAIAIFFYCKMELMVPAS